MSEQAKRPKASSIFFWTVCTILWVAFGVVLLIDQSRLVDLWHSIRGLPLLIEGLAWVVLLPWMLGLWIWNSDWVLWLRVVLVAGLGVGMIFAFFPRSA